MLKGSHHTEETKRKMSESNKGKHFHFTEDHKKKLSESLKGRRLTEDHKKNLSKAHSGKNNSFFGKYHTKESRRKMSLSHKGQSSGMKDKHHTEDTKQRISLVKKGQLLGEKNSFYGKHHTEETKRKLSLSRRDTEFYNEHGCLKSRYPYNDCFTKKFKDKIRALHDNKCVVTGMTNEEHKAKYGMSLCVHHWMYDKDATDPFYFVPVTNEINGMANFNKSEWQEMFNGIAEDKFCELMR